MYHARYVTSFSFIHYPPYVIFLYIITLII